MNKQVEFFFDYGSPTTYLAYTQLPQIAERTGATIIWRPALLGGIFKETGNRSPAMVPAKSVWMNQDMTRFAKRYGVPFTLNPFFPINTLALMRGAVVAQRDGYLDAYNAVMFTAIWVDGKNLGEIDVVGEVLTTAGLDPAAMMAAIQEPEVKEALKVATMEAVERGAFGMPTLFVGDDMFFGQDRLMFVEEALAAME